MLAVVVFASSAGPVRVALAVFLIAALTDALDGYFARLLNQESPIGRQLDPLIDKVIVAGCYIYLATIPDKTGVYPWMVTAIVVRELLIQGLRSLLEGQGQRSGPGWRASSRRGAVPLDLRRTSGALPVVTARMAALGPRHLDLAGGRPDDLQRAIYLVIAMPALRSQATRD